MTQNENNFFKGKKILITGHTGFKGSWLTIVLNYLGAVVSGVSREKKEGIYAIANIHNLLASEYFYDIGEKSIKNLEKVINEVNPDIIFHFAAQSLVIQSYKNPKDTIFSNIIGTYNVLESSNNSQKIRTLVISTTDKVYRNPNGRNDENSDLGGEDFYSTSKVSAEIIIDSFINIFKKEHLNISIVRSGNVIGGGDRSENRIMTDILNNLKLEKDILLRMPNATRPWQYILDSIDGYLKIAEENYTNRVSEIYNLNSVINNKYNVKKITELMIQKWESKSKIVLETSKTYNEVKNLTINSEKAKEKLGWSASTSIEQTISKIIAWEKHYLENSSPDYCLGEVESYYKN
jgi:CDP-glucose 4,6-dehydratase